MGGNLERQTRINKGEGELEGIGYVEKSIDFLQIGEIENERVKGR
jgi:hypothetical protein